MAQRIKKGDQVKILSGKDRGKTGEVLKVVPRTGQVVVGGLNLHKKRVRPKRAGEKGETVLVPRPLAGAKIMPICPSCGRAVRVSFIAQGLGKVRICKKCQATWS